jgi:MSHA biogenesis protein MshJ
MKQQWQALVQKVDALTLRERVVIFAMTVVVLFTAVNELLLAPRLAKQKEVLNTIKADQARITQMQAEIARSIAARTAPDSSSRARLTALKQEAAQMQASLMGTQKGLVSPDKMGTLLEDILKRDGALRVVSVKTLPPGPPAAVAAILAAADKPAPGAAPAAPALPEQPAGPVFAHGVEITVQGGYLDMLQYMSELENMPWQLLWGRARLRVDEYPKATLTLTVFTLSLDKKWLNL